jgi:hypothetical protein
MADHPDFFRPAEEALSRLANFRTQNSICVMTVPAGRSPSPSSGLPSPSMSPILSVPQQSPPTAIVPQFQASRTTIPPTAYALAYNSVHQVSRANHMPCLGTQSPSSQPLSPQAYEPLVYPEPLECMTYKTVCDRVYLVLRDNLTD